MGTKGQLVLKLNTKVFMRSLSLDECHLVLELYSQ